MLKHIQNWIDLDILKLQSNQYMIPYNMKIVHFVFTLTNK